MGTAVWRKRDRGGGVARFERVHGDLASQFGGTFFGQPFHNLLDDLVVGGAGPGDQLMRLGAGGQAGGGHRGAQHPHGLRRAAGLERVDDGLGLGFRRGLLVQLLDDLRNLGVVPRPGKGDQLAGVGPGTQGRLRHHAGQRLQGGGRRGVVQAVHLGCAGGVRRFFDQLLDQSFDHFMVLGPSPDDQLASFGAQGKVGFGHGFAEEPQGVERGRLAHPLQLIDALRWRPMPDRV